MFADDTTIPLPAMYIDTVDPAVTYTDGRVKAGRLWLDTSTGPTGTLKKRNAANDGWNTLINFDGGVVPITNADHTATPAEDVIIYDLSGGVSKTLTFEPAANRTRRRTVKNKASSTATLIIEGDGSETIDGEANVELAPGDKSDFIVSGAGTWESI